MVEDEVSLSDIGAVLILQYPDGRRAQIRLRSVDNAAALRVIAPLIVDVFDPSELCERLMAPLTEGENQLTETTVSPEELEAYLKEDRAVKQAEEAEKERQRAEREADIRMHAAWVAECEAQEPLRKERKRIADLIWASPSRLRRDREKGQETRLMQAYVASLQIEAEDRAREAATAAAEAVRAEFVNRRSRIEAAFHAGRADWKETR